MNSVYKHSLMFVTFMTITICIHTCGCQQLTQSRQSIQFKQSMQFKQYSLYDEVCSKDFKLRLATALIIGSVLCMFNISSHEKQVQMTNMVEVHDNATIPLWVRCLSVITNVVDNEHDDTYSQLRKQQELQKLQDECGEFTNEYSFRSRFV